MKLSKEFIAMFREEAKKAQWEINRWNGKSIDDLVVDYLERKELKPEDFKGVVVLTVEEANLLLKMVSLVKTLASLIGPRRKACATELEGKLIDRIEQAEGKK